MEHWSDLAVGIICWVAAIALGFINHYIIGVNWLMLIAPIFFFVVWGTVTIVNNLYKIYTRRKSRNREIIVVIGKELLTIDVVTELDYVLLSNKERNIYGYGKTFNIALNMLADDFRIDKEYKDEEENKKRVAPRQVDEL